MATGINGMHYRAWSVDWPMRLFNSQIFKQALFTKMQLKCQYMYSMWLVLSLYMFKTDHLVLGKPMLKLLLAKTISPTFNIS